MKIAEVGVNVEKLPNKETLIRMALNTPRFYQMPKDRALKIINKEIKDSGLFKTSAKRVKKSDINDSRPNRLSNARKGKVDKAKDKK